MLSPPPRGWCSPTPSCRQGDVVVGNAGRHAEFATALKSGALTEPNCAHRFFRQFAAMSQVSSTDVQRLRHQLLLSYCIKSVPVMASLQTLSAALAAAGSSARSTHQRCSRKHVSNHFASSPLLICAGIRCSPSIQGVPEKCGRSIRNAEPLMHDRARRRVLQKLLLLGTVVLDGKRARSLVKPDRISFFLPG